MRECFTVGHGSPFVAQLSMANATTLYKALFQGLEYRGTAFYQCFTTCQPEHGVGDEMAQIPATRIRDSRGMPDFISNSALGETVQETVDIKGNPMQIEDLCTKKRPGTRDPYLYTTAPGR